MDAQRPIYPQRVREKSFGRFHDGPRTSIHRFGIEKVTFAGLEVYVTLMSIRHQFRRRWNIGHAAALEYWACGGVRILETWWLELWLLLCFMTSDGFFMKAPLVLKPGPAECA